MNIVVSVNKKYILPLKAMLVSLLMFHQDIDLWILNMEGVDSADILPIFSVLNESQIHIKRMPQQLINETRFSPSSLSRIFIPFLLTDIDRALYLDADILIRRPIDKFYNSDFQDKGIIAVSDHILTAEQKHKEKIGFAVDDTYVNSGVLLMNLDYLRKHYSYEAVMEAFNKFIPPTDFVDQDFINLFFKDDIVVAGDSYNYQVQSIVHSSREKAPHILHYIGPEKPWGNAYFKRYFFCYKSIWKEATGQDLSVYIYFKNILSMTIYYIAQKIGDVIKIDAR